MSFEMSAPLNKLLLVIDLSNLKNKDLKMYGHDAKTGSYFCLYWGFEFCGIGVVYACMVTIIILVRHAY